ncbi:hypothetical protein NEHOM01_1130 [Nematocida homosporus]|uniref:uncharacterized protein n=1 Tax=Nematocida homosporus TaxID=1912981 RepID=UPI00221E92DF|nr:uncharacterized protein NEHOM01_1130 [Nematocida homosporus]KAI5185880.1 hypothetical protein NEHOM01_1130 [Nematocida homosporus]
MKVVVVCWLLYSLVVARTVWKDPELRGKTSKLKGELRAQYKTGLSLYYPYMDDQNRCIFGDALGDAMVISRGRQVGVSLLANREGSSGYLVAKNGISFTNWRVDVSLVLNTGIEGVGIWLAPGPIKSGQLLGGDEEFTGLLVYLNAEHGSLKKRTMGVATRENGRLRTWITGSLPVPLDGIIRLEKRGDSLELSCGDSTMNLRKVGVMNVHDTLPSKVYLAVSARTSSGQGDVTVKAIAVSHLIAPRGVPAQVEDYTPQTRSSLVWLVFLVMMAGVGYYLYSQQKGNARKNKKVLRY